MLSKHLGICLLAAFLLRGEADVVRPPHNFSSAGNLEPVAELYTSAPDRHQVTQGAGLKTGQPLRREIARDETQTFAIKLGEGQYAEVVFEWHGIDLNVAVYDPQGKRLIPSDVIVFPPGPVSVAILAGTSGMYKLEVTSPVKQKISGVYWVNLADVRSPSLADRIRSTAQSLVAEGRSLKSASESIIKYKQSLAQWQHAQDVDAEAQTLIVMGDLYRSTNELANAKASYEDASRLWNAKAYVRGVAYATLSIGTLLRSSGSSKDALGYYSKARTLFSQIGDRRGEASALYGQAFTYMLIGQTPQALECLQPALEIRTAEGDSVGQASALNMMADAYRILGDLEKSLTLYDQTSEVLRGLEYRSLEANVISGRVLVYDDLGDWQQAQEGYRSALSLYDSLLGEHGLSACSSKTSSPDVNICRSVASAIDNLGETYNSMGNPARALEEFSRSLVIRDRLAQPRGQGSTRFHLGYTHFLLGDTPRALEYYQSALEFQQRAGDEKGRALTLTYLGMAYVAQNQHQLALERYQEATALLKASGNKRAQAITLDKLAAVQGLLGDFAAAWKNYDLALEIWRAIKDVDGESLTLYNRANDERAAGDLKSSSEHSELATALVESLRTRLSSQRFRTSYLANKANYYELSIDLKMLLSRAGNSEYIASAFEANEKAKSRVLLDTLNEAGLGRVEFNQTINALMARAVSERLSLLQRLRTKAQTRTNLLAGAHTSQQVASIDKDIATITEKLDQVEAKIRTQNPRFAALTKPKPSTLAEIQHQLDANTLLLEYALGDKRSYVWVVSPDRIKGVELAPRDQVEAVARRVTEALTQRNREVTNETLAQRNLRVGKAENDYFEASEVLSKMVLEPVASLLGRKRLVIVADGALQTVPFGALPVPAGPVPLMSEHEIVYLPSASVLALQRRELAHRKPARYAVAVLADPVFDAQDSRVAKSMGYGNQHQKGVAPARRKDTPKTAQAPKVSPKQGGLSELPKQGRPSESKQSEQGAVLKQGAQSVKPKQSPQTSTATAAPPKEQSALASALRDVGLDPSRPMPRLIHSLREARSIFRFAGTDQSFSALDFKASRETATSAELSKYQIIHFATHGVLDIEHPELSGIVLSMVDEKGQPQDGYLRLHEIYNLNLPAELVVLSACQTGVGKQIKGEGLIALTRGFMYAGAKSIVASLWKVDDVATSALMAEFYKQMFVNKLRPAAALRVAQLKISQDKRWQSPYYWAGFFLQGEWK